MNKPHPDVTYQEEYLIFPPGMSTAEQKKFMEMIRRRKMDDTQELTFARLREVNSRRSAKWMRDVKWSLADWMVALIGEIGEGANNLKKISRIENGLVGNLKIEDTNLDELKANFKSELADALLYLDLLAEAAGVNLAEAVIEKFNSKSKQLGFEEQL